MSGGSIPVLQSERLALRAFRREDLGHLLALAHDPEVTRHLNEGEPPTASQVWQRMAMAIGQWGLRGYGMLAIEDADGFVGRLGIYHPFDEPDPQLSYIVARRGWGQGYATEAASLMLRWMMSRHRPHRLVSHITPDNAGSQRVAEKLGGRREGMISRGNHELGVWIYPT